MDITCTKLWTMWSKSTDRDFSIDLVNQAKARIAKFSKEDWSEMSKEAVEVTNRLADLVKNNIPVDNELAEKAFDDLMDHLDKWFFKPTYAYVSTVALITQDTSKPMHRFFDQFEPGLGKYISKLLLTYSRKTQ